MILWMERQDVFGEEGQVCWHGFQVNLFSILLICSVAAPPRASTEEEGGFVGIVQGGVLGLEVRDGFWQVE